MKVFLAFLVFVFSSFSLSAQTPFNPQAEGERLERLWWDQQKNQDISRLVQAYVSSLSVNQQQRCSRFSI
jgi:hypothetical protein